MRCLYIWARALREGAPMLILIENVPRFPVALLKSLFEDMYWFDFVILDAKDLGSPARRRRLYVVMTLRGRLALTRSLADIGAILKDTFLDKPGWDVLFCLPGADDGFSAAVQRRARDYLRVFRDRSAAYDLDQLRALVERWQARLSSA